MSLYQRKAIAPAGVFIIALLLRVLHLVSFSGLAYYRLPFGDARSFATEAERILASGIASGDLPYFQGPLYPIFLAIVRGVGLPLTGAYWIQ